VQVFDASSMIYAWDNYPIGQFPGLWEWMAEQINEKELAIPRVAFEEVKHKTPECAEWLRENEINLLDSNSNEILQEAMRIKGLLGIVGDNYRAKGVDENDLFIIATAKLHGGEVVSDEARQAAPPKDPGKKKIPAVCSMSGVDVPCINFIEFLRRSEEVFR
jgi:hypothetical protein